MTAFDEYYKKWKERNNTTEVPYKNLGSEDKQQYINNLLKNRSNEINQRNNANNQSTWNQVQNIANNNLNNFNQELKSSLQKFKEQYNQTILNSVNDKRLEEKKSNPFNVIGKTIENTWLGGKSGIEQQFNYVYKAGRNHLKSEDIQKIENVVNSSELNNSEKAIFLGLQKSNNKHNQLQEQNGILEKENELMKLNDINTEKIKEVAETSGFDKNIKKNNEKINKNIESIDNPIMKKIAELAPSVGNMVAGGAISTLNPVAGTAYFALSSAGSYYDDAKERGMTNKQSEDYATIMGLMEGITEEITFGNINKAGKTVKSLITGTGKEIAKEGIEKVGKTTIKTALKNYGISISENALQESIMEPLQEITATVTGGADKANWDDMGQRMLQSGINGGLTALMMDGANAGINSCVGVVQKIRNGQAPTQQEIKSAVQDADKKFDVEKMIIDSTQQQIKKYKNYIDSEFLNNNSQNLSQPINQNEINNAQNITQEQQTPLTQNIQQQDNMQQVNQNEINNIQNTMQEQQNSIEQINSNEINNIQLNKIKDTGQKVVDQKSKPITDSSVSNNSILSTQENVNSNTQKYSMQESKNNSGSFNFKEKQLEVIQNNNPMQDDYHTGIRNIKDIKTFEETLQDSDWADYDEFNPDYTRSMAEDAIKTGKITVYSSYPIEQGTFISPSYMEAESYSGDGKVYSKEVDLNDVAWIDPTQGQYAKVENNSQINTIANNQNSVYNNSESEGGINEQIQSRRMAKISGQFNTRIQQDSKHQKVEQYSAEQFKQWEQSVKPIETEGNINGRSTNGIQKRVDDEKSKNNFSQVYRTEERTIRKRGQVLHSEQDKEFVKRIKNNYDKEAFIFDDSNTPFGGGLSIEDNSTIYFGKNALNEYGYDFLEGHEIAEDIYRNHKEVSAKVIDNYIDKIQEDKHFGDVFLKYLNELSDKAYDYYIDKPQLIAKEILCDLNGYYHSNSNIKNTILNELNYDLIKRIQNDMLNLENKIYNKRNSKQSSFSVNNKNQTLNLPTKENIQSNTTQQTSNIPISENMKQRKQLNNITNMEEPNIKTVPMDKGKLEETKIAKILTEPVKKQKPQQRAWALFTANLIDKGSVFETLSLKTDNRELQGKYDAILSSGAKGQYAIGNDRYIFEDGKKTLQSKSLTSIIDEVGDKVGDFQEYMYHQLNIDRMTLEERFGGDTGINYERKDTIKNKPVFGNDIDAEYSRKIVEEYENKYPEFKSYAQDVYDYLDANKKELVDTGVIPQELSDKFKEMYPHYVPIARIGKNNNSIQVPLDTQRTGVNSPIKRAKGGSQDMQPLFHTIADKTMQTYKASARNAFGVELKHTLEQNDLLNSANEYTDIDTIIDTMTDDQQTGLTEGTKYSNPTFTVFENGEKVTYEINQDMYDALKPQSEKITKFNNTKPSKVLNTISNIRRGVLTEYNPLFSITNALKDAQDVVGNSQHATKTFSKFPEAYAQIVKKGYWYNEYIQNGGEQNSYFKDGEFELENNKSKAKKVISMPLEAISKVNNVIEMAPRLSEYIASREQGRSIETSMLDAARVTTNFKAGGDITKALNRNGATFLNAGVQGMAQQVRNIREANAKGLKGWAVLLGKWAVMGAPAILLNHFIWGDDDDYDELQDYVKDNYYVVGKTGDNQFIRIPKGRTTAVIQKLVANVDQYVSKDKDLNWDNFAEDFWGMLSFTADNVAPNNPIDNNVISPIVQVAQNKSWYGEDIVPSRLQDVPEAEQYDETTDEFSKWVGKILNISPMKINYLLDQYGGGVSDVLLPLGTPQAENNPIEDKFTTNSIIKNKNPGEFYDKLDKLKVKSNSLKSTDEDTLKYKYMSGINEEMSKLYKQKREEQNSSDDDKTKKQKVQIIQNQINELAKKGLNDVDNFKINTTTATVGNEKYYKNISAKTGAESWEKLSKEEIEKNKNISLETYASFKRKVAQETIAKRQSGELKEEQQLKNVDKTKIILDSNCSDEEKLEVYKKYIGTEDKKVQLIDKLGFPIKGYLNYKTYNFESDKDEEGESVSGTKKTKVVNYLKSIPDSELSLEYKHIIAKIENISEFDNNIVKFIDNRNNLTKDEKKELLEIIGFKVDKNGYVQTTSMIPIRKYIK